MKKFYNVRTEKVYQHVSSLPCGDSLMVTGDISEWIYKYVDESKLIPDLPDDVDDDIYNKAADKIVSDMIDDFLEGSGVINGSEYNLLLLNEYRVNIKTPENPDVWDANAIGDYITALNKEDALEKAKDYLKEQMIENCSWEADTDSVDNWQYQIKKITSLDEEEDEWEIF